MQDETKNLKDRTPSCLMMLCSLFSQEHNKYRALETVCVLVLVWFRNSKSVSDSRRSRRWKMASPTRPKTPTSKVVYWYGGRGRGEKAGKSDESLVLALAWQQQSSSSLRVLPLLPLPAAAAKLESCRCASGSSFLAHWLLAGCDGLLLCVCVILKLRPKPNTAGSLPKREAAFLLLFACFLRLALY
jgi:hypothetical protein